MEGHGIRYENAAVHWTEALPLGNGTFGAMAYLQDRHMRLSMNHYEVYYSGLPDYSRTAQKTQRHYHKAGGDTKENIAQRAKAALAAEQPPMAYQKVLFPPQEGKRLHVAQGESLPAVGDLQICYAPQTDGWERDMRLSVERAAVSYRLHHGIYFVETTVKVLQQTDSLVCHIRQAQQGTVSKLIFEVPRGRNSKDTKPVLKQQSGNVFSVCQSFGWKAYPQDEPFRFCTTLRLLGAAGKAVQCGDKIEIELSEAAQEFDVLVSVATELEQEDCRRAAEEKSGRDAQALPERCAAHERHWETFFAKSSIILPDTFLENLWYLHLYVLECCSGRGGVRREQASGLNGLWDIRHLTLWGSVWYWDVNIQATYWGTYAANHLELSKVFCEGFLQHETEGIRFAEEFHGLPGYAGDYPHPFYNCIGPWCAQFLWWQYEYSGDETFLRQQAYPHFLKQVQFWQARLEQNEAGTYEVFPDISPEQGPLGHNVAITIASLKYLFRFTRRAAEILRTDDGMAEVCSALLARLPEYETAEYQNYGVILKDSHEAAPGIHLRHPSLLMPIFPAEEWNRFSPQNQRDIAEATVRYAIDHTELGVFGFGWLACAAARMGLGELALRTLYEKGYDLHLRANGLGAEETNRWLNLCLVNKPPMYYPAMMECTGETVAAVTELLLQSSGDGMIEVFPALPETWRDCAFERLLAKDGVEVSAWRKDGKTVRIELFCRRCGTVRLRNIQGLTLPGDIACRWENEILVLEPEAGKRYVFGGAAPLLRRTEIPLCYTGHTGARIYAGKNQNTDYERAFDAFVCDHYVADTRHRKRTVWFFGMGWEEERLPEEERRLGLPMTVLWENETYTARKGYGFEQAEAIGLAVQGDERLAQRYLVSDKPAVFLLDLPRGQYDIFIGCSERCDMTIVCGGVRREAHTARGTYAGCILPVLHEQDGLLRIELEAEKAWKVHTIVCNKHHVFS